MKMRVLVSCGGGDCSGCLPAGDKLGRYEILSPIGAGGMGEVYRARDTKLKRDVAIQVLPDTFARDPGRMAPFQREVEVLVCSIIPTSRICYGVEDRALVMEFVEGESPKGPKPFEDAWKIALADCGCSGERHTRGNRKTAGFRTGETARYRGCETPAAGARKSNELFYQFGRSDHGGEV
ncbi:MAG: hypothetical protein JO307_13785 [Bryobacterales bacterium]|nr:hypothetical protein [Bryobacterales bacterium]MBV9401899.1 hypothetical protein [Bryobacterales bacterium]